MTRPDLSLAREFEATLAWWRDAGVDCDYANDATAWLADGPLDAPLPTGEKPVAGRGQPPRAQQSVQAERVRPIVAPPAIPITPTPLTLRRDLLGDSPPSDLAAFRHWWLEAPALATSRLNPRIPPRGERGAALMVLVPQPEEQDRERLMEGPQGRLLTNILAAMGLDDSMIYLASALPSHTPVADLSSLSAGGMDTVLAHHIGLAAPKRILVLGTGLAAMLGPTNDQLVREINHGAGNAPVMVSETLNALMDMPRLKARLWRRWIEWSASL